MEDNNKNHLLPVAAGLRRLAAAIERGEVEATTCNIYQGVVEVPANALTINGEMKLRHNGAKVLTVGLLFSPECSEAMFGQILRTLTRAG